MNRKPFFLTAAVAIILSIAFNITYATAPDQSAKSPDPTLSKITFIHYKKAPEKPPFANPGKGKQSSGVYGYIAKGAKWKVTEDILLNPACNENPNGSMDHLIINSVIAGLNEWEIAGDANNLPLTIFGNLDVNDNVSYDDGTHRGYNTISFGHYDSNNVIAITTIWGRFSGPVEFREITEVHILMNDYFVWGNAAADHTVMDVQNIITHELGHYAGMDDIYQTLSKEETMYGYSTEGETKKRDLYKGDIAGITALYR